MNNSKIFIIGLPRTSTTSLCVAMLELGYKVAHTAYVHKAFDQAQVIADTPIFNDYQTLDKKYPNSKFIYLNRNLSLWVPSIKQLLNRMKVNLLRSDGGFNLSIKRCYTNTFSPFTIENIANDDFLVNCYIHHQKGVFDYFKGREHDLLTLDLSEAESYQKLLSFCALSQSDIATCNDKFEKLNVGSKVTAWKDIKHPLKVESTKNGRVELS